MRREDRDKMIAKKKIDDIFEKFTPLFNCFE
jgi:hypothetical protein